MAWLSAGRSRTDDAAAAAMAGEDRDAEASPAAAWAREAAQTLADAERFVSDELHPTEELVAQALDALDGDRLAFKGAPQPSATARPAAPPHANALVCARRPGGAARVLLRVATGSRATLPPAPLAAPSGGCGRRSGRRPPRAAGAPRATARAGAARPRGRLWARHARVRGGARALSPHCLCLSKLCTPTPALYRAAAASTAALPPGCTRADGCPPGWDPTHAS